MGQFKSFNSPECKKPEAGRPNKETKKTVEKTGSGRLLYQAVVLDFFSNPESDLEKSYNGSTVRETLGLLANGSTMPRGSILAKIVSDDLASDSKPDVAVKGSIFLPMFPHLAMPVKPGERVWVIYETLNKSTAKVGYWLSRISSDIRVDDINYTHYSREALYGGGIDGITDAQVYGFAPAGTTDEIPGSDSYNLLCNNSFSYNEQFVGEPVPRFSQRVGDLVLQGSNNTLICLGQDRKDLSGPEKDTDHLDKSGTIDMVTGRGQPATLPATSTAPSKEVDLSTVLKSEIRDYSEIDKFPSHSKTPSNIAEGNPDYTNDLSRVYVSSNTDGDVKFGGTVADLVLGGTTGANSSTGPYVVVKSTHPRIIARSDGSVKIVHQGGSSISMDSSGNVQIVAAGNISMGTATALKMQPFVRADDLEIELAKIVAAITAVAAAAGTAIAATPANITPATATTAGVTVSASASGLSAYLAANFKSSIIKGE